jgi:hypothetical protein
VSLQTRVRSADEPHLNFTWFATAIPGVRQQVGVVVILASIATISAAVVAITLTLERKEHR